MNASLFPVRPHEAEAAWHWPWVGFREWQLNYNKKVHGELTDGNYLSLQAFRTGGVQGHTAPKCALCEFVAEHPDIKVLGVTPATKFYIGKHDECLVEYRHNHSTAPLRQVLPPSMIKLAEYLMGGLTDISLDDDSNCQSVNCLYCGQVFDQDNEPPICDEQGTNGPVSHEPWRCSAQGDDAREDSIYNVKVPENFVIVSGTGYDEDTIYGPMSEADARILVRPNETIVKLTPLSVR